MRLDVFCAKSELMCAQAMVYAMAGPSCLGNILVKSIWCFQSTLCNLSMQGMPTFQYYYLCRSFHFPASALILLHSSARIKYMKCALRSEQEQDALFMTVNTQYLDSKVTQTALVIIFSCFLLLDYFFNIMLNLEMSWFWVSF